MAEPASHAAESAFDRFARRYAHSTGSRPWLTLAIMAVVVGLAAWFGSGIRIRSNMEDLFPEHTPAVQAARQARETLKSVSQMVVVFGSPDRQANRKLALAFCDRLKGWPQVSALECRRDISMFRKNAALFLSPQELLDIEKDVRQTLQKATEKELVDDALTSFKAQMPEPSEIEPQHRKDAELRSKGFGGCDADLRTSVQIDPTVGFLGNAASNHVANRQRVVPFAFHLSEGR